MRPNARLANSLRKIETDFEKEIARIMPRTAPRRTENRRLSADLSSYHDGALPGGSARPRNRHGSTSILGRVAVCIDGTYCVSVFASRTDLSSDGLGQVTLLSSSQRGASQKQKETITVDPNPVMHVTRGDRQSIISGGERSELTSAD
jgi:hypothetical protein